ncbi:MAG: hypothetical protein K9L68_00370 [Spirochaetales bacterium]|nr:hypothetical protein [Spirochaetales bacterium]MCF7937030.1 hypothetical protein [Spirochaetales bacterium]
MNGAEQGHLVAEFILEYFYYIFLGLLFLTIFQRKHRGSARKKMKAVIYLAIFSFVLYALSGVLIEFDQSDWLLLPVALAITYLLYRYRGTLLPFSMKCVSCGTKLDFQRFMYHDNNLCAECDSPPEEDAEQEDEQQESDSESRIADERENHGEEDKDSDQKKTD